MEYHQAILAGKRLTNKMASIAAELFQVLTKHPYKPVLRLIPQEAKCTKKELDAERALEAKNYMVDTTRCITKGGKLKATRLFDIFTRYSHRTQVKREVT